MAEVVGVNQSNGVAIAGMVVGICSVVLSIPLGLPLGITAIILSTVAFKKKQKQGFAITGLITGILGLLSGVVLTIAVIGSFASYTGMQSRADDQAVRSQAAEVIKLAERNYANTSVYPDFETIREQAAQKDIQLSLSQPSSGSKSVQYVACGNYGAIVQYWNNDRKTIETRGSGNTESCN